MFSVPTVYRRLLGEPRARLAPFRPVRRFVAGGERLSAQLVEHWKQAVGGELLNLYGLSQTICACMITPPGTSVGTRPRRPVAQGGRGPVWTPVTILYPMAVFSWKKKT